MHHSHALLYASNSPFVHPAVVTHNAIILLRERRHPIPLRKSAYRILIRRCRWKNARPTPNGAFWATANVAFLLISSRTQRFCYDHLMSCDRRSLREQPTEGDEIDVACSQLFQDDQTHIRSFAKPGTTSKYISTLLLDLGGARDTFRPIAARAGDVSACVTCAS